MGDMIFQSIGGAWHLKIDGEGILARIHEVNPARWAVTSVPTVDLTCDAGFIAYMDTEKKGRILVNRVIESRDWMFRHLRGRGRVADKVEDLRLDDIDTTHAEGEALKKTAERILREKAATDTSSISLKQVRDYRAGYAKLLANGDGILCPETVPEPEVAAFVKDIMATVGSVPEFSGNPGASLALLDKFLAQGAVFTAWKAKGTNADGLPNHDVYPWADATSGAADRVKELDAKLEQYFAQCDLVKEDPTQAAKFRAAIAALDNAQVLDPAAIAASLTIAPIAEPRADGALLFDAKFNPAYEAKFAALREHVLTRALGRDATHLTRDSWRMARGTFAPYWAWLAAKTPEPFEAIDAAKLKEYLSGPLADRFRYFSAVDSAAAPEVAMLSNLEKLILFQRWLLEFTNNFVNLSALYDPRVRTIFEMGTLVIDSRRLEFTVRVVNRADHKKVAAESRIFLAYVSIFDDPTKPAIYEVAAPVTKGERGRLIPGKRGVFYANDGKVYDAVVQEIIEHPISIPEAIKAPFRRTAEFISKKIEEYAASRAAAAEARAQANLTRAAIEMNKPASPEAPKKTDPAATAGIAASLGIAVAALGSATAFIVSALAKITFFDAVLAIVSIVGFIALFAGFLGWLKLRLRNLGPLFEANGWAVNPRMKVNGRIARIFTRRPGLPKGHLKELGDPSALVVIDDEDDSFPWKTFFTVCLIGIAIAFVVSAIYYPELIIAMTPGK